MKQILRRFSFRGPRVSVPGQKARRRKTLLRIHDRWLKQVSAHLLRQSEGIYGYLGHACRYGFNRSFPTSAHFRSALRRWPFCVAHFPLPVFLDLLLAFYLQALYFVTVYFKSWDAFHIAAYLPQLLSVFWKKPSVGVADRVVKQKYVLIHKADRGEDLLCRGAFNFKQAVIFVMPVFSSAVFFQSRNTARHPSAVVAVDLSILPEQPFFLGALHQECQKQPVGDGKYKQPQVSRNKQRAGAEK